VDHIELLRRLAVSDASLGHDLGPALVKPDQLDPKTVALVRLGALVAVSGAVASYGAHADAAVAEGATEAEIVDVLVAVVAITGLPCVVSAASKLALALGYDIDDILEHQPSG